MANDFVNTITTNDGTTYDVQDKRLEVTAADAGKVVSVDSNGNLSLVSGGTKLYRHQVKNSEDTLVLDFIATSNAPISAFYSSPSGRGDLKVPYWIDNQFVIVGSRMYQYIIIGYINGSSGDFRVISTTTGEVLELFEKGGLTDTVTEL